MYPQAELLDSVPVCADADGLGAVSATGEGLGAAVSTDGGSIMRAACVVCHVSHSSS